MGKHLLGPDRDYRDWMLKLGIPQEMIMRISSAFGELTLPSEVLDDIVAGEERVGKLHPDKYPWDTWVFDNLKQGLEDEEVNCGGVWKGAEEYVRRKYFRAMPAQCATELGASSALTNLLQIYALAKYHNIKELGRRVVY